MTIYTLPVAPIHTTASELRAAIARVQEKIEGRRMIGELSSPEATGRMRLTTASHIVTGLRVKADGQLETDLEFVDNEQGRMARTFVEIGRTYPVHGVIRAFGTRHGQLVRGMEIITVDLNIGAIPDGPAVIDLLGDVVR